MTAAPSYIFGLLWTLTNVSMPVTEFGRNPTSVWNYTSKYNYFYSNHVLLDYFKTKKKERKRKAILNQQLEFHILLVFVMGRNHSPRFWNKKINSLSILCLFGTTYFMTCVFVKHPRYISLFTVRYKLKIKTMNNHSMITMLKKTCSCYDFHAAIVLL